jgi:hypothetical protein
MGTHWDSFDQSSQTAFFINTNSRYHENRKLLYNAMTRAGFTNYPEEWWHYDFGNQFWGFINSNKAKYGIANTKEVRNMSHAETQEMEGPFILNLSGPLNQDTPPVEARYRFILGGYGGAEERLEAVREQIRELQVTSFAEYVQEVGSIIKEHDLVRVDY